jgi:hypothetical protein
MILTHGCMGMECILFGSELFFVCIIFKTDLSAQYNYFFCRPQLCTINDTGLVWYNFPDDDVESPILKQGVVESVTLDYG